MKIYSKKMKQEITDILTWENSVRKAHWKPGRSAQTLAEYVLASNPAGKKLESVFTEIFKTIPALKNDPIHFNYAYPEFEVKFDDYKNGRKHDLGVFGVTERGKNIFVGVEAKVDEPFGNFIGAEYAKAVKYKNNAIAAGKNSYKPDRIEDLLQYFFYSCEIEKFSDLRYQLLHGLGATKFNTGSIDDPDYALFCVIAFRTKTSGKKGFPNEKEKNNYQDYKNLLGALSAAGNKVVKYKSPAPFVKENSTYEITLKNKKTIYSSYVEIDALKIENGC